MSRIEIALASDANYFCGIFVTACSIVKSCKSDVELRFNVLDGGIDDRDWTLLVGKLDELCRAKTSAHTTVSFNRIRVDTDVFDDCPSWNGSRMIYARLLLPRLLPEAGWCVYCDGDFLWYRDIAELWQQRLRDDRLLFIGVLDPAEAVRKSDEAWCRERGYDCPADEYCCAGLSFVNLKAFRNEGLQDKVWEMNALHPPMNDQTIFNSVCSGRKLVLSEHWQCFSRRLTPEVMREGVVIHYAGAIPWKRTSWILNPLTDATMLWHRKNAEFCGISVWQSLRRWFPIWYILWHRGIYWLAQVPGVKWGLKALCAMTGHLGVWQLFEANTRRVWEN